MCFQLAAARSRREKVIEWHTANSRSRSSITEKRLKNTVLDLDAGAGFRLMGSIFPRQQKFRDSLNWIQRSILIEKFLLFCITFATNKAIVSKNFCFRWQMSFKVLTLLTTLRLSFNDEKTFHNISSYLNNHKALPLRVPSVNPKINCQAWPLSVRALDIHQLVFIRNSSRTYLSMTYRCRRRRCTQ